MEYWLALPRLQEGIPEQGRQVTLTRKYIGSTIKALSANSISTPEQPRDRRFQLRAEAVNVTEFIMRSACEKAERALSEQTRFVLDDKQWKAFMSALDRPAKMKPRLRRLFHEQGEADRRSITARERTR